MVESIQGDHAPAKVAVILPYLGKSLPSWFDLFALSTVDSAPLVDWYIFVTEAPRCSMPSNVHLIRVTRREVFQRLARLDSSYGNTPQSKLKLESYFQHMIDAHPYILVEMKPALGFLFSDYVSGYSQWAYADLDLLVGRMDLQITPDLLRKYDIITLSFGDNNRLYMRGQFTLHKNNPTLTNLWQGCDYLSKIGSRLEGFFEHSKGWDFHSAEGCYSKVVANTLNISILYLPIQFSDAFRGPLEAKETIFAGGALHRCYEHPISESVLAIAFNAHHPEQQKSHSLFAAGVPLRRVSPGTEHCSYWIDPKDQVCTEFAAGNATITIEDGTMTTRTETRFSVDDCREASIAHFQGGKRGYFHYTTRLPPISAHAMVITEAGIIPLKLSSPAAKPFSETYDPDLLRAGRVRSENIRSESSLPNVNAFDPVRATVASKTVAPLSSEPIATAYCIVFSDDLKRCTRALLMKDITVLAVAAQARSATSKITMIAVGWLHEYSEGGYAQLLDSWDGATILVLAFEHDHEYDAFVHNREDTTVLAVRIANDGSQNGTGTVHLPDKTLYNIGLDAARTELVLLMPSNMHLALHLPSALSSERQADSMHQRVHSSLREREENLHSGDGSPVFIVIPVVVGYNVSDASTGVPRSDKAVVRQDSCGTDQPKHLTEKRPGESSVRSFLFHAQELLKEHTDMLPVLFNTSACPHGAGFVRFPEELNGVNCYGASILRVLAGASYSPQWPQHEHFFHAGVSHRAFSDRQSYPTSYTPSLSGRTRTPARQFVYDTGCQCMNGADSAKRADMVAHLNRYFLKAVELRKFGLQKVYSRARFEQIFDGDQK